MSLLTIVQSHCRIHALNIPTSVVGNTDVTISQILGLVNELVEDVVDESKFQAFTREALFMTTATEDQGAMTTLAPNGYLWVNNETFYDRTLRRPVYGPINDNEWQALKAIPNPGPFYKYRIRGDHLLINPVPTAPFSQIVFEYASSYGVNSVGGVGQASFIADTDVSLLPEKIIKKGLSFRWKRLKGLPYQADESDFYKLLNSYIAKDGTKRQYDLASGSANMIKPGIFVPSGNWFN